jgi:hypothetical protein
LSLIERSERDPDLEPLRTRIVERFRSMVGRTIDVELASAERAFRAGKLAVTIQGCDRIAKLLEHLDGRAREVARHATEALVTRLVASHGAVVEPVRGEFVFGTASSFTSSLMPSLVKGLESKGYLPARAGSPWAEEWKQAPYRMSVQVSEHKEGFYLSSQSRVTLIRVHLSLTVKGVKVWEQFPGARARVPVPNLPTLAAGASAPGDIEQVLYKDALGQIAEKVGLSLTGLPECGP